MALQASAKLRVGKRAESRDWIQESLHPGTENKIGKVQDYLQQEQNA